MIGGRAVYRITRGLAVPGPVHLLSTGAVLNGTEIPTGVDILNPTTRSSSNGVVVQGLILMGASQTLDGIVWQDTVFVNTKIRYLDGDLKLIHVRFVNCTFQITGSGRAEEFANYVALSTGNLTIG